MIGQKVGEKKRGVLSVVGDIFKKVGSAFNGIKNKYTKQFQEAEKVAYDTIVDAEKVVYDTIAEAEKVAYDSVVEAEKAIYDSIVEAEKVVYDTILEAEKITDEIIEQEVEGLFEPDEDKSVKTDL